MKKNTITTIVVLLIVAQYLTAQQWSPISNNHIWNLNSGNIGIGINTPTSKLDVKGEIKSELNGISNLRLVGGQYGTMIRNDGVNTLILLTNYNDANGGWNSYRPFRINNATGDLYLAGGKMVLSNTSGNVSIYNGKLGVGVYPTNYKLDVKGKVMLRSVNTKDKDSRSYLNWSGHTLVMGTPVGTYAHNTIDLEPGGSSQSPLFSQIRMYTAQSTTQKELKIQFNTMGNSFINNEGKVGIGTTTPREKLDVNGTLVAKKARIEGVLIATKLMARSNVWADYVFEEDYRLKPLKELESYINANKRLPDVPTTNEIVESGIDLAKMNIILLKKVEELTLHLIDLNKKINSLESQINNFQN